MKKINRIKACEDFALTIKKGKAFNSSSFTVHVNKNNYCYTRVGISASKKLGCAVVRNKIRRQIRSMCDSLLDYSKGSYDIVIIARSPFLNSDYNQNLSLLNDILNKEIGINS